MMVETILESSQDFGMSGPLPQWKRELLQRRAARSRPPPSAPPPPPPAPPPPPDDEELRYGPGIVKRLKSRYLSLALREAPRRRPSVLRRAASLEHLLDERPPPAPPRTSARVARPASLAAPPPSAPSRRDSVKRARSVDALSRLDEPSPPAPPSPLRGPRPPRRPAPLLRDAERPPPDVVRSTLRKFEATPTRRVGQAARVSAAVRGLEAPRSSTPEPRGRSPSPAAADISAIDDPEAPLPVSQTKRVSREALDGIARAGCSVRYAFEAPAPGSHLPLAAATNPVLLSRARTSASPRRVGVIKPMPPPNATPSPPPERALTPDECPRLETPPPDVESAGTVRLERKEPPPSALVEPIPRTPPERPEPSDDPRRSREATPEAESKPEGRALASRRLRPAAPAATSVVFNFCARTEVPDYIENDGIVLRARRPRYKAGESGVVLLRGANGPEEASSEDEVEADGSRPPSPCSVRFVNDNVLINGRSSLLARTPTALHRARQAKLKLQFDDSLTRTFEYPSETSLCEDAPPVPASPLACNTPLGGALAQYTPSKTVADAFQLGLTRTTPAAAPPEAPAADAGEGDARPCAAESARSWSEARTLATDLLF